MTNVVNFAAFKNDRRAAVETQRRETDAEARRIEAQRELSEKLGGTIGAQIIAAVVTDLKEREQDTRPVPAYCDPSNEVRGSKYDATKGLGCKDIAARIRQDIKDAIKGGALPAGLKVRCYMPHYGSIEVIVTQLPQDFLVLSAEGASWRKQCPNSWETMPGGHAAMQSQQLRDLMACLTDIHGAYNRDNSDSMTDYFDTRYYGHVSLDYAVRKRLEQAEIEASPGDVWADCNFH